MANNKSDKKRLKRKAKQKQLRVQKVKEYQGEKLDFLVRNVDDYIENNPRIALNYLKKALKITPDDTNLLNQLGYIGTKIGDHALEYQALDKLHELNKLPDRLLPTYCEALILNQNYEKACQIAEHLLNNLSQMSFPNKRPIKKHLQELLEHAHNQIQLTKLRSSQPDKAKPAGRISTQTVPQNAFHQEPPPKDISQEDTPQKDSIDLPDLPTRIPIDIAFDTQDLEAALKKAPSSSHASYELTLEAYHIRLNETFDHLICLGGFNEVRSLWYQEETVKKVLKRFRGRALLADEVGLGKTIEALMIFCEYYQRGMIKNGLILTPTPLVSQWQEELKSKFNFQISSTDDSDYRAKGIDFWQEPFVLASINQAKSAKNAAHVAQREYDIVIVDEAHHLKNRNTQNWKLVNALKKKYLLLLSATPVENNLLELYNLITLLKPGQLKTATAFRQEFMTRGDPTDPQNREKLKGLLGEVMIRNTRAIANINLPPRFAQTIRIQPTPSEQALYERVTGLVKDINATNGNAHKLLLKHLLAEAGSSPQAISLTLEGQFAKRDLSTIQEQEIQAIRNLCRSMDDTQKNKTLIKILKANPGKFIIFVKYLGTLDHLSHFLDWHRINYAVFSGSMSNQEKDDQIQSFKQDIDIMLTTEIGGEGRNLQFCHQMINYDLPWNPMKIEQRIGRIHRIGQEKTVQIFNFCNIGTMEDYILEILDKKINMFEMVIGEIDMILGRIQGETDFSDLVYDLWVQADSDQDREESFQKLGTQLQRSKTAYLKTKQLDEKLFNDAYEL